MHFENLCVVTGLTEEDEEILEKNLVWVFASRRSGTSWLAKELLSHNTEIWNEPLIGFHLAGELGQNSPHYRMLDRPHNKHYFFYDQFKSTWIFYLRKLILNRIYAQFPTFEKNIIVKEPNGSQAADILSECFPNSKIILLLRDGRDVINSNLAQISDGGRTVKKKIIQKAMSPENRVDNIRIRSKKWVRLMEVLLNAYNQHNKNLKCTVRYENLRSNTVTELKKLYEFIDVKINDDELRRIIKKYTFENLPKEKKGVGRQKQFAKVGIWKEKFSSKEIQMLEDIMGDTLRKLEYM